MIVTLSRPTRSPPASTSPITLTPPVSALWDTLTPPDGSCAFLPDRNKPITNARPAPSHNTIWIAPLSPWIKSLFFRKKGNKRSHQCTDTPAATSVSTTSPVISHFFIATYAAVETRQVTFIYWGGILPLKADDRDKSIMNANRARSESRPRNRGIYRFSR